MSKTPNCYTLEMHTRHRKVYEKIEKFGGKFCQHAICYKYCDPKLSGGCGLPKILEEGSKYRLGVMVQLVAYDLNNQGKSVSYGKLLCRNDKCDGKCGYIHIFMSREALIQLFPNDDIINHIEMELKEYSDRHDGKFPWFNTLNKAIAARISCEKPREQRKPHKPRKSHEECEEPREEPRKSHEECEEPREEPREEPCEECEEPREEPREEPCEEPREEPCEECEEPREECEEPCEECEEPCEECEEPCEECEEPREQPCEQQCEQRCEQSEEQKNIIPALFNSIRPIYGGYQRQITPLPSDHLNFPPGYSAKDIERILMILRFISHPNGQYDQKRVANFITIMEIIMGLYTLSIDSDNIIKQLQKMNR
jgi:hypothetical protein